MLRTLPSKAAIKQWTRTHTGSEWLFIGATVVYLTCHLPLLPAYRAAESMLILVFLWLTFVRGRRTGLRAIIVRDPLFRLSVAMMLFLLIARLWYVVSLPPLIDPETRETRYFLKPVMVLLIALGFSLAGARYRWALAGSTIVGFGLYLATNVGIGEWELALAGRRVDFGIHNAQHTGMFFGTTLLALLCFTPRMTTRFSARTGRLLSSLFVGAAIVVSTLGVVATQTRAVWIGILIAGIAALALAWRTSAGDGSQTPRNKRSATLGGLLLTIVIGATAIGLNVPERVLNRFSAEDINVMQYADLPSPQSDPGSSHGVRLTSWRVSLEWLQERPLLGWGPGSAEDLIDQSPYFSERFKRTYGHLHNSFIESLIANGVTGSLILLAMIAWIGRSAIMAYREDRMPRDVFIFGLSFFGFWVTINMFESYVLYTTGHYINAAVGGFLYSFCLPKSLERASA